MNIKNGLKFGQKISINRILITIKKNLLVPFLVASFLFWAACNALGVSDNSTDVDQVASEILQVNEISGIARVKDGDSIMLSDSYEVRLVGIDAPEYKQTCFNKKNYKYSCGKISTNFLKRLVNGKKLICKYSKKDIYDRYLGDCFLGDIHINAQLIKTGMAIIYSFGDVNQDLQNLENDAMLKKVGIWQGVFLEPRKYRKKFRKYKKR